MKIRYHLLWLLLLCLQACLPVTQEQPPATLPEPQDTLQAMAVRDIFLSELEDRFIEDCLNPFLASKHIQLSCSGCDRFRVSLVLIVDNRGAVTATRKETVACPILTAKDLEAFDRQIGLFFRRVSLPASFYNHNYEVHWGHLLRC